MSRLSILAALSLALAACAAQSSPPHSLPRVPGEVERSLYAPDRVLASADRIHLDAQTADAVRADTLATQADWDRTSVALSDATARLAETLRAPHVDEAEAAARGAEVMRLEDALKASHLALLVRVKNRLTPAQRSALDAERRGE